MEYHTILSLSAAGYQLQLGGPGEFTLDGILRINHPASCSQSVSWPRKQCVYISLRAKRRASCSLPLSQGSGGPFSRLGQKVNLARLQNVFCLATLTSNDFAGIGTPEAPMIFCFRPTTLQKHHSAAPYITPSTKRKNKRENEVW